VVTFTFNELLTRDPQFGRRAEDEVRAGLGADAQADCRIEVEGSPGGALDRLRVVVVEPDAAFEWTVALPAAPGDICRATETAMADRRARGDRRERGRPGLDRRGS
jgi:hypothetical protein